MPLRCFRGGKCRSEFRKGLVQPQIVPPFHGDQIAEPHMGQLMQDGDDTAFGHGISDFRLEYIRVADGHHADVFHGSGIVFRHINLIEFGVWVWHSPRLGIEGKAFLGNVEQIVHILVERVFQCLPAVHGHGNRTSVFVGIFSVPLRIRSCTNRGEIGAHCWRGFKDPLLALLHRFGFQRAFGGELIEIQGGGDRHIRGDYPAFRSDNRKVEYRLDVGLIKDGVHSAGIRNFELRIQIYIAVCRVHTAVKTFAGM